MRSKLLGNNIITKPETHKEGPRKVTGSIFRHGIGEVMKIIEHLKLLTIGQTHGSDI